VLSASSPLQEKKLPRLAAMRLSPQSRNCSTPNLATCCRSAINFELNNSTPVPTFNPDFSSFDDVIKFFQQAVAVYDAIDPKAYNESAEKSVEVSFENAGKTLVMKGLADYVHGFVVPNAYFHLNAMYMILRSQGFTLGKVIYIGCFMSEQQQKDWAPLKG
jgi:hypothetical protein